MGCHVGGPGVARRWGPSAHAAIATVAGTCVAMPSPFRHWHCPSAPTHPPHRGQLLHGAEGAKVFGVCKLGAVGAGQVILRAGGGEWGGHWWGGRAGREEIVIVWRRQFKVCAGCVQRDRREAPLQPAAAGGGAPPGPARWSPRRAPPPPARSRRPAPPGCPGRTLREGRRAGVQCHVQGTPVGSSRRTGTAGYPASTPCPPVSSTIRGFISRLEAAMASATEPSKNMASSCLEDPSITPGDVGGVGKPGVEQEEGCHPRAVVCGTAGSGPSSLRASHRLCSPLHGNQGIHCAVCSSQIAYSPPCRWPTLQCGRSGPWQRRHGSGCHGMGSPAAAADARRLRQRRCPGGHSRLAGEWAIACSAGPGGSSWAAAACRQQ